jgi:hypothetical protein
VQKDTETAVETIYINRPRLDSSTITSHSKRNDASGGLKVSKRFIIKYDYHFNWY